MTKSKPAVHAMILRMPVAVHRALAIYAATRGRTMTAVILAALRARGIK